MKKAGNIATNALEKIAEPESRKTGQQGQKYSRQDHVDAINQIFAEFELAYHNQYHKAYSDPGSLSMAKKYWLSCLGDFSPELLLRACRKVVSSQPYLPSLASIIEACSDAMSLYGLPVPHDAYIEACCASSPKPEYAWSHPAVYLAAQATGWFELANRPEASVYPLFEYHYRLLATRVLKGESLDLPLPAALPASSSRTLSVEENLDRLKELREKLKF